SLFEVFALERQLQGVPDRAAAAVAADKVAAFDRFGPAVRPAEPRADKVGVLFERDEFDAAFDPRAEPDQVFAQDAFDVVLGEGHEAVRTVGQGGAFDATVGDVPVRTPDQPDQPHPPTHRLL